MLQMDQKQSCCYKFVSAAYDTIETQGSNYLLFMPIWSNICAKNI